MQIQDIEPTLEEEVNAGVEGKALGLLGVINKGRDHNERPDKDTGNSISGLGSDRWVLREQVLSNCLMNDHREQNRDCLSWFYSNLLVRAKWVCAAHQSEAGI